MPFALQNFLYMWPGCVFADFGIGVLAAALARRHLAAAEEVRRRLCLVVPAASVDTAFAL